MLNKEKPVKVVVDKEKCTKCGVCIEACDNYLKSGEEGFPTSKNLEDSLFGCIQCGNCMMKCPTEAIEIVGEDIDKNHIRPMPQELPDYDTLNGLFLKRRSIRKYKADEISKEDIDKIIASAATSAVSIPPSEVKVLVLQGRKKVQELAKDLSDEIKHAQKILTPFALNLMKIFIGEAKYKVMKDFVVPLCEETAKRLEIGEDVLFYDAPCVMIFYGSELIDAEDMIIAATNATIAAESLGLGTCFIGTAGHFLNTSSKLRKKYGILKGEKVGTTFILGVPDVKYLRTFQRNFKEVRVIK